MNFLMKTNYFAVTSLSPGFVSCSELSPFGEIEFGAHVVMQGGQAVTPGLFMPSGTTALLIPGGEIPLLLIIPAEK